MPEDHRKETKIVAVKPKNMNNHLICLVAASLKNTMLEIWIFEMITTFVVLSIILCKRNIYAKNHDYRNKTTRLLFIDLYDILSV
jgi:hypothetical protein